MNMLNQQERQPILYSLLEIKRLQERDVEHLSLIDKSISTVFFFSFFFFLLKPVRARLKLAW